MEQFAHPIRQFFTVSSKLKCKDITGPIVRMSEINQSFNSSIKSAQSAFGTLNSKDLSIANLSEHFYENNDIQDNINNENSEIKGLVGNEVQTESKNEINSALQKEFDDLDFQKFVEDLSCNIIDSSQSSENQIVHPLKNRIIYERKGKKETIIIDSIANKESDDIHVVKVKITLPKENMKPISTAPMTNCTSTFKKSKISSLTTSRKYTNSHHLPIMGKAALMNKRRNSGTIKSANSDSEIVRELVTQRFQEYLLNYYEKSFLRQNSRHQRGCTNDIDQNHLESREVLSMNSMSNEDVHGISSIASRSISYSKDDIIVSDSPTLSNCYGTSLSGMSRLSNSIPSLKSQRTIEQNENNSLEFKSINDMQFLISTDDHNVETTNENNLEHSSIPTYEFNPYYETQEIKNENDTVEYDATQFLREALGDELNNYNSTDVSYINSIGTSNISALISRNDTNEYNTTIYEDSIQVEYDYFPFNKRVGELLVQSDIQYQIISQTSKALSFCKNTKEFIASEEELEAERILLIATCKRDAIRDEIHRLEYEEVMDFNHSNNYGCIKISQIVLPPKQRTAFYSSKIFEKKKKRKFADWYMCILSQGIEIFATSAVQADNDGFVRFQDEIIFDHLNADFEIEISLYSMRIRNQAKNISHETKYHLDDDNSKLCPLSPTKLFNSNRKYKNLNTTIYTEIKSSYILCGHFSLKINNIGNFGHFKFSHLNLSSLEGNFIMTFSSVVNINENYSGFLDIGLETKETISWNRRWCTLNESILSYYNYPGEENALGFIDLHYCANAIIESADRQICARPRTLLVEVFSNVDDTCNKSNIIKYFLAADSKQYMDMWGNKLNNTINALRLWNAMKCNISIH